MVCISNISEVEKIALNESYHIDMVEKFQKKYDCSLVCAGLTFERGFVEVMYFFSDSLGGYTIDGLESSLE